MKQKIIIALGGNALQDSKSEATAQAQLAVVRKTCACISEIIKQGNQVAIVHGNGPQVGRILLASETAKSVTPTMPFDVCGAMSQGYIGYHIQQAMREVLRGAGHPELPVVTLVTQLVVPKDDPGFANPTKPIGKFYSEQEAKSLAEEKGYTMKEDAGRGWRRVVASPIPTKIVEIDSIRALWQNTVVIACGGGGIPVVEDEERLCGVAAVIDKDFAAELLAQELEADVLMILTEVEKVCVNFNKPDQRQLSHMTVDEAEKLITDGQFGVGSMLPKVQAAVKFVKENPGKKAIISSLYQASAALEGKTGTIIEMA